MQQMLGVAQRTCAHCNYTIASTGKLLLSVRMDFTQTACACALLLRIRKDGRKQRHWVHPVVSKILLNGLFYKLYEDLRNCRGKFSNYYRRSIESFDKFLVLVGPRMTRLRLSVPPQERLAVTLR